MPDVSRKKIFAECPAAEFAGRRGEIERLIEYSTGDRDATPLTVIGPPGSGVSELLKQTYDRLFQEQVAVIPFYFSLKGSDKTERGIAQRFLDQFLLQTIAFRRQRSSILGWYPDVTELAELASPEDGLWIDRIADTISRRGSVIGDDSQFLRLALSSPLRATANGARAVVIIDDCHLAGRSEEIGRVFDAVKEVYHSAGLPLVLAGRRRFSFKELTGQRLELGPLPFADAAAIVESNSVRYGVSITGETRDLLAHQFCRNPAFIRFMFQAASEKHDHLENFLNVEKFYTQEIFGGRIHRHFDERIKSVAETDDIEKGILSLLDLSFTLGNQRLSVGAWRTRLALGDAAFAKILDTLNIDELIRISGDSVEVMDGCEVLTDYIVSRFRLDVIGENRAALFGESVTTYLKRAPLLMAHLYRENAELGIRGLLSSFSLQSVPQALFDYGDYAERYKGLDETQISDELASDAEVISLPQIVFASAAVDLYKPIGELTDRERSAIAVGFQQGLYTDADEIVWVAAEIDSKLEASAQLAEFWCDRLEMAALMSSFQNFQLWLISPEGFTAEAMEALRDRNAYASSRRQFQFLKGMVGSQAAEKRSNFEEYEMTVPMDGDSEIIAAYTLEEIAKRHNIAPKAVSQIKTALLEASINASEHSLSPDRRIFQKFSVADDRIVITISNRGIRLIDKRTDTAPASDTERRGWGLKLIEKLMDEVKILKSDDGTIISMTKYLQKEAAA